MNLVLLVGNEISNPLTSSFIKGEINGLKLFNPSFVKRGKGRLQNGINLNEKNY
jgi:hypothetical protein